MMNKLILLVIAAMSILLAGCHDHYVKPGHWTNESRTTSEFSGIEVHDAIQVYITQGDTDKLYIETYSGFLTYLVTSVTDGKLRIYYSEDISNNYHKTKIYLTMKTVENLNASGASEITGEDSIFCENLKARLSGASYISLNAYVNNTFEIGASGASTLDLKGSTNILNVNNLSGASELNAYGLISKSASLELSGASSAEIYVTDKLSVWASGASHVTYKGNADIEVSDLSGASQLIKE